MSVAVQVHRLSIWCQRSLPHRCMLTWQMEGSRACGLAALLMLRAEAQPWQHACRDMSAACQLMLG